MPSPSGLNIQHSYSWSEIDLSISDWDVSYKNISTADITINKNVLII